jgi:hypothetical protein
VSDKTGWEGRGQQFGDSRWARRDRVPRPGSAKENNYARESLVGYIVWGCWELKRKFRLTSFAWVGFPVDSLSVLVTEK